jgi:drug/metabolite transporter (DMT)-like permease
LIDGLLGVLIFSASLPATRVAVLQFDPVFLTVARATIAGLLGLRLLLAFKKKRPARTDVIPLKTGRCFIDHALLSTINSGWRQAPANPPPYSAITHTAFLPAT